MSAKGPNVGVDEARKRLVFDMLAEDRLRIVGRELRRGGIPFAPVKGIVLSRWIYDDVRERPYVDVDLVVSREFFSHAMEVVSDNGWPVFYRSAEMGEISFKVGGIAVEIHAEFGRAYLSRVTVAEVLARARPDRKTFGFEVLRIDDIDHFLLLVVNVVKDGFTYANEHQPEDLERLLMRLANQWDAIVDRAKAASLMTALATTATWMVEKGSEGFSRFRANLPSNRRPLIATVIGIHRRISRRKPNRLRDPSALFGVMLATLTPDALDLRARGVGRLLRRTVYRRVEPASALT